MDKIIHHSERVLYTILALLIIAFVTYEILDLIYLFYCEVSRASILENKSIALSGVPLFFNIIIALEILISQSQVLNLSIGEPAGIYIVSIQAGDKNAVTRLIKE